MDLIARKKIKKALASLDEVPRQIDNMATIIDPTLRYKEFIKSMGTLIEGFDSLTNYTIMGGTAILDTEHVKTGTASIKLTNTGGDPCHITKTVSLDLNTVTNILFRFYVEDVTKLLNVRIYISSSTTLATNYMFQVSLGQGLKTGWNTIRVPISELENSGENITNTIVRLRLRFSSVTGETSYVVFDSLYFNQKSITNILFTFDDNYLSIYEKIYPLMESYGIKGTIYAIPTRLGGSHHMNIKQLREMYKNGWDIGNHTYNHVDLSELDYNGVISELSTCRDWLETNGFTRASRHVAYPGGKHNEIVLQACKDAGIITARRTYSGSSLPQQYPIDNQYKLNSILGFDNTTTLDNCKTAVTRALLHEGTLIFYAHDFVDTNPSNSSEGLLNIFSDFLDYIVEKDIPAMTITQWCKRSRNPALIG